MLDGFKAGLVCVDENQDILMFYRIVCNFTIACGSNSLIFRMTRSTSVYSLGVSCMADYPFNQTSALSLSSGNTTMCSPSFIKISSVYGVMYCMASSVGLSV